MLHKCNAIMVYSLCTLVLHYVHFTAGVCEVTSASPLLGSFEGGATVTLEVSSTCDLTAINIMTPTCSFGSQTVPATVVDSMRLSCVVPRMDMPGDVPFRFQAMTTDYGNFDYQNTFSAGEYK